MGFFDFLNRKDKPKRLEAPKKIKYDGTSSKIEFDPKRDWKDRDAQEKDELIKIYTLNGIKYINIEIPKGEQEVLEFNLARFEAKSDTAVESYGKQIKKIIIKILDEQVMFNDKKSRSSMIINTWISLDNLLKSKALEGTLSNEGMAVLRNVQVANLNIDRTVYLQRDDNGYLYDSTIKDDLKLVKKVLAIDEKSDAIDSTTKIVIPAKKLNEQKYVKNDLEDFVKGYIVLCKMGNTIGIGERIVPWEYGALEETYRTLANTRLGKDLDVINNPEDKDIVKERLEQEIIDKSLFLENMLEEYVYGEQGKMPDMQNVRYGKYNEDILKGIENNKENVKIIIKMLEYSKKVMTDRLIDEDEKIKYMCSNLSIQDLAKLSVVKKFEKSNSIVTEEQQDTITRVASETLKIKLSRLSNNEIASYIALRNKKVENLEILARDILLSDMAQVVLKEKFEKLDNGEIINLIALKNKGGEGVEPPVEDAILSNTAQNVLKERLTKKDTKKDTKKEEINNETHKSEDEEQL